MSTRILVVEADAARARALATALMAAPDHEVVHASTVVAGLRELLAGRVDLLITNTTLQRQRDAIKLVEAILVEKKVKVAPPVMVVSADRDPAVIKRCVQAGVADYILLSKDVGHVADRAHKRLGTATSLSERLIIEVAVFLGPASRVLIEKGTATHLKVQGLDSLRQEHLPELLRWLQLTVAPVLKDRLAAFLDRLETVFRVKRNRG